MPGPVVVAFEERDNARQNIAFEGPWALFRLMDSAPVERESDTTYVYTLEKGGRSARLRITADTIRNPFGKNLLQQFRCR
jgi:type VI secretion system protein ImpL